MAIAAGASIVDAPDDADVSVFNAPPCCTVWGGRPCAAGALRAARRASGSALVAGLRVGGAAAVRRRPRRAVGGHPRVGADPTRAEARDSRTSREALCFRSGGGGGRCCASRTAATALHVLRDHARAVASRRAGCRVRWWPKSPGWPEPTPRSCSPGAHRTEGAKSGPSSCLGRFLERLGRVPLPVPSPSLEATEVTIASPNCSRERRQRRAAPDAPLQSGLTALLRRMGRTGIPPHQGSAL